VRGRFVVLAVVMLVVGVSAATARALVPRGAFGSRSSAECLVDRRVNDPRPVEKSYRDAVGDAEAGHGDITGVWISDSKGVVTFSTDVKNLHDTLVVDFDTDCDGHDNYTISLWARGKAQLYRLNTNDEMFKITAPKIVRTPSRHLTGATAYTFHFTSKRFGGTTAFFFEAHVDTPRFADVSDWAPNGADDGAHWYYDLLSR